MSGCTTWLCCGVLRAEMEELLRRGKIGGRLVFLNSMLHLAPNRLDDILSARLAAPPEDGCTVLVYGDCSPHMLDMTGKFAVGRVNAINCAQLLTGRTRYRELMLEEAFMLLPEWALRWREVMQGGLGLKADTASDFMRENRRKLVYLDTGLQPVPRTAIQECSDFTGLPWSIEAATLEPLLEQLLEAEAAARPRRAGGGAA